MKIKNFEQLISYGDKESRKIVLNVTEKVLTRLDAKKRIKSIMHMDGDLLVIGNRRWDLTQKKDIYLIGAGKACNAMAAAVEDVLGERLTAGIIIVKIHEPEDHFKKCKVFVGGHPIPNEEGMKGCKEILKLISNANSSDLFIVVMSGGSSALMSLPLDSISLDDEKQATDILLKSGANIIEINSIRRHISAMNGGRLAEKIEKIGAELIGFNISDSVSGYPSKEIAIPYKEMSGTPMCPDNTTVNDALAVIQKYNLSDKLPVSIMTYLDNCGEDGETPKYFLNNTYYMINTLPDSCIYAQEAAEELGIKSLILTSYITAEAKETGSLLAAIAKEIQNYGHVIEPPCIIISAGEAVTTISDSNIISGHGGPSQEMALSFAIEAEETEGICLLSIDSEGTDGTTLAAGGITDSRTLQELKKKNVDVYRMLREHASYEVLAESNSIVYTGNTGTNVCDINIMYIPKTRFEKSSIN